MYDMGDEVHVALCSRNKGLMLIMNECSTVTRFLMSSPRFILMAFSQVPKQNYDRSPAKGHHQGKTVATSSKNEV